MGVVTLGLDIGQRVDPTALAALEVGLRPREDRKGTEAHYTARYLARLPLGTPYPQVAARVAEVATGIARRTGTRPILYVDATGVGTPVLDALRAAQVPARIVGVFFTHGDRRVMDDASGEVRLGKAWLVTRLQVLLQGGRLHLPRTAEAAALQQELLDYEIRIDTDANDKYGAFKVGSHDDLVTALGLACQVEPRRQGEAVVGGQRALPAWGGSDDLSFGHPAYGRRAAPGDVPVEAIVRSRHRNPFDY